MPKIREAPSEFLSRKRIAMTGVSRNPQHHGRNVVYQRLWDRGVTCRLPPTQAERASSCGNALCRRGQPWRMLPA